MHVVANNILIPEMAAHLRAGKRVEFTPTGVSMRPFIEGGADSVVLQKLARVRVGDICLAELPSQTYVLHRVIHIKGDEITLMGDGNLLGTEHCTMSDIIGTVVSISSPKGMQKCLSRGWLWRYLCHPRWFFLKVYRHTILKLY